MAGLYQITTNDGVYVGKDSSGGGWYMKDHHILKTFNKLLKMNIAPSEDSPDEQDIQALDTLEYSWAQQVNTTGFAASKYLNSLAIGEMNQIITALKSSLNKQPTEFNLSPFEWLEKVWQQPDFEVAEALCIMLSAKTSSKMLNTQVDFLTRPGGNITEHWVVTIALSQEEFKRKAGQQKVQIPKELNIYRVLKNTIKKDKKLLGEILSNEKVSAAVAGRIKDSEIKIGAENKDSFVKDNSRAFGVKLAEEMYENFMKALKSKKPTQIKNQGKKMEEQTQESVAVTINEITAYQPLIKSGYQKASLKLSDFLIEDRKLGDYYEPLKRTIHNQFLKDLNTNRLAANLSQAMYSNSVLSTQGTFINTNGNMFYHEQMSIEYGGKFGALQKINKLPDEFGEYAFGRPKIVNDNGQMITLFTSSDPDLKDRVHTFEQMTIF